jgi:predicted transcriptional regulator of viral defense system
VPRRAQNPAAPAPDQGALYELAAQQAGYFTPADAREAGYSSPLLEYHVRAGRFERVRRGVFRLVQFPPSELEDWVVAWLWSERKGVFSHESALRAHGLSDVLPDERHLSVPVAWAKRRLRVPEGLILHYADVSEKERTWFGSVPVTTPKRSIIDVVRDELSPELVKQAVRDGLRRGLFARGELSKAFADAGVESPRLPAQRKQKARRAKR